ncbi:MAG TPA: hypothetical protein VGJ40_00145 [Gaiellaceae bacterium]
MTERKEEPMSNSEHPGRIHPSATSDAVVAAHEGPMTAAIDTVRWVRRGFLRRLTRDTVN